MADINSAAKPPQISRQRMDYEDLPDGSVKAILTISLPGGIVKRFEAITTKAELQKEQADIIAGELDLNADVVGWNFGKFLKGATKGLAKVAKSVASSKVFKLAASGLALAAPLLGPIAPAALAVSAGMGVASKLAKAGAAVAAGASSVADALTRSAASDASKLTSNPAAAASLLADANRKRLGAERVAAPKASQPRPAPRPIVKPKAPPKPAAVKCAPQVVTRTKTVAVAPVFAPMSEADLLARARAGRVRSNTNQVVDERQLLAAHNGGRIFWVQ